MSSHLEEAWKHCPRDRDSTTMIERIVDAVIDDLRSSYELAMQGEGIDPKSIKVVIDTVDDFVANHYDFLDMENP